MKYYTSQFITKWGNHNYSEGHVLQKRPLYYKAGGKYYKLGQGLLKCGISNLLQSGSIVTASGVGIIKWGNFISK